MNRLSKNIFLVYPKSYSEDPFAVVAVAIEATSKNSVQPSRNSAGFGQ